MGHSPQAVCIFRSDTGDNGGRAALLPLAPFLFRIFKAQFIAICTRTDTAPAKREAPISVEDPPSRCGLIQLPRSIVADTVFGADCFPEMTARPSSSWSRRRRKKKEGGKSGELDPAFVEYG
ncbi:hypothetical protein CSIM01_03394 [Colletotrichum simmondsii]|uniref:Uncharacterized protein n=1 Tax=Colletotrichum simmondsii TaxID=703756 RepID=A0A135SZ38_9PEZI|nr:hypothetical protein CSIM01_03394 [Colletotrichum simmondsii]